MSEQLSKEWLNKLQGLFNNLVSILGKELAFGGIKNPVYLRDKTQNLISDNHAEIPDRVVYSQEEITRLTDKVLKLTLFDNYLKLLNRLDLMREELISNQTTHSDILKIHCIAAIAYILELNSFIDNHSVHVGFEYLQKKGISPGEFEAFIDNCFLPLEFAFIRKRRITEEDEFGISRNQPNLDYLKAIRSKVIMIISYNDNYSIDKASKLLKDLKPLTQNRDEYLATIDKFYYFYRTSPLIYTKYSDQYNTLSVIENIYSFLKGEIVIEDFYNYLKDSGESLTSVISILEDIIVSMDTALKVKYFDEDQAKCVESVWKLSGSFGENIIDTIESTKRWLNFPDSGFPIVRNTQNINTFLNAISCILMNESNSDDAFVDLETEGISPKMFLNFIENDFLSLVNDYRIFGKNDNSAQTIYYQDDIYFE